jgi:uncharacterized protein DUF5684
MSPLVEEGEMNPETVKAIGPIVMLVVAVFEIAAFWRIFTKAGRPGWASLVPIYNIWVLLQITGKPGWWTILVFVPLVNIVIGIIETVELARVFGKSGGFAAGLIFLPFIFYPVLAWGDAQFQRSAAPAGTAFA